MDPVQGLAFIRNQHASIRMRNIRKKRGGKEDQKLRTPYASLNLTESYKKFLITSLHSPRRDSMRSSYCLATQSWQLRRLQAEQFHRFLPRPHTLHLRLIGHAPPQRRRAACLSMSFLLCIKACSSSLTQVCNCEVCHCTLASRAFSTAGH